MMEPCSALQSGCGKGIIGHVLNFFVASIILAWVDILCETMPCHLQEFGVDRSGGPFWTFNCKNVLCQM